MTLTHDDVRKILELLDEAQQLDALEIQLGDFTLRAVKPGGSLAPMAATPAPQPTHTPSPQAASLAVAPATQSDVSVPAVADVPAGMVAIRSPMMGTFYRRPAPEQPLFCEAGDRVAAEDTLCLVEVMKMFNTVKASITGRVHKVCAEHGALVQRDQILLLLEPEVKA